MMGKDTKYSGDKILNKNFGRLTIVENLGVIKKHRYVKVRCECGEEYAVKLDTLISGDSKSCGCLQKEIVSKQMTTHGLSDHPLRSIYDAMISRCYKETDPNYPTYGAVGVRVCEQWNNNYPGFAEWALSNGWKRGLCIDKDKKSVEKPGKLYSPEHCSLITQKENSQYKANNHLITYKGETLSLSQWADKAGLKYSTFWDSVKKGIPMEDIMNTPTLQNLTFKEETFPLMVWSEKTGLKPYVIRKRLKMGWSVEDALTEPINEKYVTNKKKAA